MSENELYHKYHYSPRLTSASPVPQKGVPKACLWGAVSVQFFVIECFYGNFPRI